MRLKLRPKPRPLPTFRPMRLRWSCSGSAAHLRKVQTSLATWLMVAGVPATRHSQSDAASCGAAANRAPPTVVVLQDLVVDGRRHADGLAGEVGVVVESFSNRDACRRLAVTRQQAEDVVLSTVPVGGAAQTASMSISAAACH